MSGSYCGGGQGGECGGCGGGGRDLSMSVLEVLFKEPDLVLHRSDQPFHFGVSLLLKDFFNLSSRGNHVF